MSRRQGLDYAETDPEAKSLEFAQLALRTSLSNFQGYLACLQLAYLYQKRGDSASEAKFIEKSLTYHVTTGTYLKLAQFHRDHGNFKKMHYYNTMAQEMDPRAVLIEGPQPSLDAHKN